MLHIPDDWSSLRPSLPRWTPARGPARGSDDGGVAAVQLRRGAAGPAGGSGGDRCAHGGCGKRSSSGRLHLSLPNPPTAGVVVQGLGVHVPHRRRDLRPRRARRPLGGAGFIGSWLSSERLSHAPEHRCASSPLPWRLITSIRVKEWIGSCSCLPGSKIPIKVRFRVRDEDKQA